MESLDIVIQKEVSQAIYGIRQLCYPDLSPIDDFDGRSQHILLCKNENLIAYGRLTPGPDASFFTYTKGLAEIPNNAETMDLGFCMVHPDHRRKNFLELILLIGIYYSKQLGYKFMNGAIVPGSPWITSLRKSGFQEAGELVRGRIDIIQPLVCYTEKVEVDWNSIVEMRRRFNENVSFKIAINNK